MEIGIMWICFRSKNLVTASEISKNLTVTWSHVVSWRPHYGKVFYKKLQRVLKSLLLVVDWVFIYFKTFSYACLYTLCLCNTYNITCNEIFKLQEM